MTNIIIWKGSSFFLMMNTQFPLFPVDDKFPSDATVEFVFSSGPEKIKGNGRLKSY